MVVCSYTEKDVPFKAPKDFDTASGQLILQNYTDINPTMFKPYEVRCIIGKNEITKISTERCVISSITSILCAS